MPCLYCNNLQLLRHKNPAINFKTFTKNTENYEGFFETTKNYDFVRSKPPLHG